MSFPGKLHSVLLNKLFHSFLEIKIIIDICPKHPIIEIENDICHKPQRGVVCREKMELDRMVQVPAGLCKSLKIIKKAKRKERSLCQEEMELDHWDLGQ
jgi:hypothetical protein